MQIVLEVLPFLHFPSYDQASTLLGGEIVNLNGRIGSNQCLQPFSDAHQDFK